MKFNQIIFVIFMKEVNMHMCITFFDGKLIETKNVRVHLAIYCVVIIIRFGLYALADNLLDDYISVSFYTKNM